MKYKVTDKRHEYKNDEYALWVYGGFWLPVSKDDFDRVSIGDTIELLISVVPA